MARLWYTQEKIQNHSERKTSTQSLVNNRCLFQEEKGSEYFLYMTGKKNIHCTSYCQFIAVTRGNSRWSSDSKGLVVDEAIHHVQSLNKIYNKWTRYAVEPSLVEETTLCSNITTSYQVPKFSCYTHTIHHSKQNEDHPRNHLYNH